MTLATAIRTGFSIMFTYLVFNDNRFNLDTCPAEDTEHRSTTFGAIFTAVVALFGNFFPVLIILRIYTLE